MGEMTRERMTAIVSAYGVASARWPEAERAAARDWAAVNAQEFAALAQADAALDAALDLDARAAGDDEALVARILARGDANVVRPQFGRMRASWMQAAALAACAVMGLALGFSNAPARDDYASDLDAAFGAAFDLPVNAGEGAGG